MHLDSLSNNRPLGLASILQEGPLGPSQDGFCLDHRDPGFCLFCFSCRFLFVLVIFNFSCFPRQMFKRQPLRVLAHSVASGSCSLLLMQELIIPLLLIADLSVILKLGD